MDDSVQVFVVPAFLIVSQRVMHLNSALGVAKVRDFVLGSQFLDRLDIGFVVFAHVSPGESPVLLCGASSGIKSCMVLAILGASIVSEPDIVAQIGKEQGEGLLSGICWVEPFRRGIIALAMLDKN